MLYLYYGDYMKNKNVVFMGTPDFAVPVLEMLIEKTNVVMVVCQPDKKVGRRQELLYNPVKNVALKNNIPVFQPTKIRTNFEDLKNLKIDLIVTCAYGQIIPKEVLEMPKYGAVNVHASILPKYRGSAPIQWAIMNGDKETGITIMFMDEGMDSGDIIKIAKIPILALDNVGTMHDKLSILGKNTLESVLEDLFNNTVKSIKQPSNYTLAPMLKREDEKIDFKEEGIKIINKIRALSPWPLAYFCLNGKEIKVINATYEKLNGTEIGKVKVTKNTFKIGCNDGYICLKNIKPFGKKEMEIKNYLNGIDLNMYNNMEVE